MVLTTDRVRRTPLLTVAVIWLVAVDALNRVPAAGGISLAGALTLLSAGLAVCMAYPAAMAREARVRPWTEGVETPLPERLDHKWVPFPLTAFAVLALARLVFGFSAIGVQNVAVLVAFVGAIAVTAAASSPGTADLVVRWFGRAGMVSGAIYLASLMIYGNSDNGIYEARSFGLVATIPIAVLVAANRRWWVSVGLALLVAASLSRTATVVAVLVLFVGYAVRGGGRGRLARLLVLTALGAVATWELFTRYAPLRDRFSGGDNAVVGGVDINTSGRLQLWTYAWKSAMRAPIFGQGPGSAEQVITAHFHTITHPHNDYLRLVHDYGFTGLILFVAGLIALLVQTWMRGRETGHAVHWAAFLCLGAVLVSMVTSNVIVYPFVMVPLGVLVGASMARSRERAPAARHHQSDRGARPPLPYRESGGIPVAGLVEGVSRDVGAVEPRLARDLSDAPWRARRPPTSQPPGADGLPDH